jgi:hypothetical protein
MCDRRLGQPAHETVNPRRPDADQMRAMTFGREARAHDLRVLLFVLGAVLAPLAWAALVAGPDLSFEGWPAGPQGSNGGTLVFAPEAVALQQGPAQDRSGARRARSRRAGHQHRPASAKAPSGVSGAAVPPAGEAGGGDSSGPGKPPKQQAKATKKQAKAEAKAAKKQAKATGKK